MNPAIQSIGELFAESFTVIAYRQTIPHLPYPSSRWPNHAVYVSTRDRVGYHLDRTITLLEPPLYPNLLHQERADSTSPTDFAESYSSPYSIPHRNGPIIPSKSVNDSTRNQDGNLTTSERVHCMRGSIIRFQGESITS
jgi:hypothetical protein